MDKKDYRLKGHESFTLREGWLTKGLNAVHENPRVFSENSGADALGVGTNMAKSIRYWMRTAELTKEHPRDGVTLTEYGNLIFQNDPYFEDIFSLWVIHANIARNFKLATSWNIFFNNIDVTSFKREELINMMTENKSIIAFRKLFTDIYLNPREIIFERLPKIFKSTATTDTIAAVQVVKNEIDSHIHFVRATAIKIIRDTFGFAEETNLQQSLLTWYDNLPEVAKNSIFSARVSSLIEYIQAVDTGDTDDIASKIVRKTTGMFIEDWKSGFESKFKDELKEAVDEVLSKKENAVDTSQKILLMSDDGTSVERFYDFDAENLSATATFFRNALEDVMEEYDGILENNEKIGVLMDAIKKLMT